MSSRPIILFGALALCISGCHRCYTCTGQTAFGETERDVCGRPGDIEPLITHLESDTVSPWVCKRQ